MTLVLPAHNEEATIVAAITEAESALAAFTSEYEIIVVDDGSTDRTLALAQTSAARNTAIKVISLKRNEGYGSALRRGFHAATKPLVAFTDSDCQFNLNELKNLVQFAGAFDVMCGFRIDRQDSRLRCFYSKVYNLVVKTLFAVSVRDCDCALKVFKRPAIASLALRATDFTINAEILAMARIAGWSVVEVGVTHRPRLGGLSKVSCLHSIPVLFGLARLWLRLILAPKLVQRSQQATLGGSPRIDPASTWPTTPSDAA